MKDQTEPIRGSYRLKLPKGYILEVNAHRQTVEVYAPRNLLETFKINHSITPQDVENVKETVIENFNLQPITEDK